LSFLFIILNTITLAMDNYTNAISTENFLKLSNKWFTIIFTIEMLFKIIALGCRGYAREGYNLFDGVLVMISLFDFSLEEFDIIEINTSVITVFRSLRVLKILKLATKNEDL